MYVFAADAIALTLFLLFQLVMLPVEFNASNQAKQLVVEAGIVNSQFDAGLRAIPLNVSWLSHRNCWFFRNDCAAT